MATWHVQAGVAPWVVASAVLELAYIVLLAAAYRRADVSVIYPIARGAAPVLVLAAAIVTGVATGPLQLAGRAAGDRRHRALWPAVATGPGAATCCWR